MKISRLITRLTRSTRLRAVPFALGALVSLGAQAAPAQVTMTLQPTQPGAVVNPDIFGQFSEFIGSGIYGGIWVGAKSDIPNTDGFRTDVVQALRALDVPNVRWPGGCYADRYDWRDGVGPRAKRPVTENSNWGGTNNDNAFGSMEFLTFAQLIGAKPFMAVNVGSEPPSNMVHWLEYLTSTSKSAWAQQRRADGREQPWKIPYLGIGNELWGCGGNMTPDYAADVYRRYRAFVQVGGDQHMQMIAPGANGSDYHWTDVMMKKAVKYMDGISLHYYTIPRNGDDMMSATDFDQATWIDTLSKALFMDTLIEKHSAIMDKYDPTKRVALDVDEWGTWFKATPGSNPAFLQQQNTLRDAMVAALTLNIFVDHADRVRMANIAQMVNVLQAMILTDNNKMVLTPTYYVFKMFKPYQGAKVLPLEVKSPDYSVGKVSVPAVQATAVLGKDGYTYIALANLDPTHGADISVRLPQGAFHEISGTILTAPDMSSKNTFDAPDQVKPKTFTGAHMTGQTMAIHMPSKAFVMLRLD
ncbi:MAG: alpha-L-arabinofuranosidase C-terminal domain-containing protein [Rhodanobacter sp.]